MKKIMKIAFVTVFTVMTGYNIYTNQKVDVVSDLVLDNVEVIAACEVSAVSPNEGHCVKDVNNSNEYCAIFGWGPICCAMF